MKKIKLNDKLEMETSSDEYKLNPSEKYVINMEEEMEFQMAIMMSFKIMGPNPTNEFVDSYYGVKPLWKTAYSQGIVVKAENESDYFIVMECSSKNKGYKHTAVILTLGGCM